MTPSAYTEDTLAQQTTADYLKQELGWESVYAYNNEDFGPDSLLGRESDREVVLTRILRAKLEELNFGLPSTAYDDAIRQIVAVSATPTRAAISEAIGRLTVLTDHAGALQLRLSVAPEHPCARDIPDIHVHNRIRTFHGSPESSVRRNPCGKPDLRTPGRVLPGFSGKHPKERFRSFHRLHAADDHGYGNRIDPGSYAGSHPGSQAALALRRPGNSSGQIGAGGGIPIAVE